MIVSMEMGIYMCGVFFCLGMITASLIFVIFKDK
jgi:hypothetical protein